VSQYADDPRLDPIIERAIALDVPVLAHTWIKATGNMTRESTCHHVVRMARRYPALKIWMAHVSGRCEEAGRVVRDFPNVCVDVSGGEPEDGIVECLRKHLGPERIFWGSDAPGRSFAVQMAKVLGAEIAEDEKQMILGENVRRWLHV
jgi:predicted TIM-barrel fold metal-dependent hydrolase